MSRHTTLRLCVRQWKTTMIFHWAQRTGKATRYEARKEKRTHTEVGKKHFDQLCQKVSFSFLYFLFI